VLNSKVKTAAVLVQLTRDLPLDFLLFLGSAQSFFNEARRAIYAAGCCFLDAYAQFVQEQVRFPVHLINWGFWSHSIDAALQRTLKAAGLGVIEAPEAMDAIERILAAGTVQVGFVKADPEALHRMGLDRAEEFVCLPKTSQELADLGTLIAAKLF
jgi:hypothetical protein